MSRGSSHLQKQVLPPGYSFTSSIKWADSFPLLVHHWTTWDKRCECTQVLGKIKKHLINVRGLVPPPQFGTWIQPTHWKSSAHSTLPQPLSIKVSSVSGTQQGHPKAVRESLWAVSTCWDGGMWPRKYRQILMLSDPGLRVSLQK